MPAPVSCKRWGKPEISWCVQCQQGQRASPSWAMVQLLQPTALLAPLGAGPSSLGLWMGCTAPHCWRNIFITSSGSCCEWTSRALPLQWGGGCAALSCSLPAVGGQRTQVQLSCPLSLRNQSYKLLHAKPQAGGCSCTQALSELGSTHLVFGGIEPKAEAQGSCCPMHHQSQQLSRRTYSLWKMSVQVLPNSLSLVVLGGFLLQGN